MWVVAINRMRSLIYANYAPKQRLCHPYLLSRIFWTETMTATFGSSGILSNCQSTTILGMSMKDYHQQRFHHDHDFTRFTITCTRAWRRRRGWAPSSRTGRRSQSESTGSAPCQVRSRKQQISSRYFLTFVSECFRRDSTLLRMSEPWWGEGRHLQCSSNACWAREGRPGLSLGENHIILEFQLKKSMRYYHKLSRGHQHFSDTTLRELCIQASWQMEIPKNKKKLVDRSENRTSTDLGILCIFWPEVLVKIADDVGRDLERAEEHEEEAEQDVQAADHQALAHLSIKWSPFSSIWKTNNEKNHLSVGWHLQASCMRF